MNDPGADVPISQVAGDVDGEEHREEEELKLVQSAVWWFTATACPLIAGTVGPMASAFNICAIAQYWRLWIPPGKTEIGGRPQQDPSWLLAVNLVSLVFAIAANFALLLNMARRISFPVGQSITIIGWIISSIILIVLIGVANSNEFRLEPASRHALSQAYYYAIMSAALYMIVAFMMMSTVYGAYTGRYPKQFSLSTSQRTLMLQTISFMIYLLGGAAVYGKIEGWSFPDAVFWADYTLLTIGIGVPFAPTTHLGRGLLFPYAFGGLMIVGLIIGSIRSLVLERGKEKMQARMTETEREHVLKALAAGQQSVNLGYLKRLKLCHDGLSELQNRQQNFEAMKQIKLFAEQKRRWTGLIISTLASATLWFIGALIFMLAHGNDQWTYFVSLYFSFTSLMTIGYGDFQPNTNSARPFFVFWSLIAVPTLTIWIGDLSDTVVKSFKELTIWVGSVTILPETSGTLDTVHHVVRTAISETRAALNVDNARLADAPDEDLNEDSIVAKRLAKYVQETHQELADSPQKLSDLLADDEFLSLVIVQEMKSVQAEVHTSPPKEYTFAEWVFYLKLAGEDESTLKQHRELSDVPVKNMPHLGEAGGNDQHKWSWLGNRSPLMAGKSEADWIVCALRDRLEEILKGQRAKKDWSRPTSAEKSSETDTADRA